MGLEKYLSVFLEKMGHKKRLLCLAKVYIRLSGKNQAFQSVMIDMWLF